MKIDPEQPKMVEASQAEIQERSVTVQVLTIGKRQVTQALYRQLVEEEVIDHDTGKLKGEIWGWVNMHVGECDEKKTHLHAIWEREGLLRRACVYQLYQPGDYYKAQSLELGRLVKAYIGYVALSGGSFPQWKWKEPLVLSLGGQKMMFDVERAIEELWLIPSSVKYLQGELEAFQTNIPPPLSRFKTTEEVVEQLQKKQARQSDPRLLEQVEEIIQKALQRVSLPEGVTPSKESVYAHAKLRATELTTIEQTWKQSYQAIQDAGQLFIAVSGVWK